ncbi:hypothetical protein FOL47_007543 [Perkinsus chesapeaki]|uniref:Rubisco LSMT substrate-binding domain-containing protein n=1 Tax=Perkinsus chesapeaki TaxID=330153 RepID=A0A7J6MXF8_PERCH|nr:hypothetical protein FOL47_007543 [Perkinsus chesapeaki]
MPGSSGLPRALSLLQFLVATARAKDVCREVTEQGTCASPARAPVGYSRMKFDGTYSVLDAHVYYGQPILKVPLSDMITLESDEEEPERVALTRGQSEDEAHLVEATLAVIAFRFEKCPGHRGCSWLRETEREGDMLALNLTQVQLKAIAGTSVESVPEEMIEKLEMVTGRIAEVRPEWQSFVRWAFSVVMRYSRVVHPDLALREQEAPQMVVIANELVNKIPIHTSPERGTHPTRNSPVMLCFDDREIVQNNGQIAEMVVLVARRDMRRGEEIFLWAGQFSNSELLMRYNLTLKGNPVGIGGGGWRQDSAVVKAQRRKVPLEISVSFKVPSNWDEDPNSKVRALYKKFNCTSTSQFIIRISSKGRPDRDLQIRCFRVGWFMTSGWFSPKLLNMKEQLEKWPPPEEYRGVSDWLAWTQADNELTKAIAAHCKNARERLRENMDSSTARYFRDSVVIDDTRLWKLRIEETRAAKKCLLLLPRR